jgi:hypothetical protein
MTNPHRLEAALTLVKVNFKNNEHLYVCNQTYAKFVLNNVLGNLNFYSQEYNSGRRDKLWYTAKRIKNLVENIRTVFKGCGKGPTAKHITGKLYVALTWYRRFGIDNPNVPIQTKYLFESLGYITKIKYFHL